MRRKKADAQQSEEGFAAARLTIARLVFEQVALEEALAAARREVGRLNTVATKALAGVAELHHALATALAAPADGEEKPNG